MGLRVGFVRVVQVVGGHQWDLQFLGQTQQVLGDPPFNLQTVVHDLAEVVLLAEDLLEFGGGRLCGLVLSQAQLRLDFTRGAASGGNQALGVVVQQLAVPARIFAEDRIQGGDGAALEEVVHAFVVVGQQRHVGVEATAGDVISLLLFLGTPFHALLVIARGSRRHVGLDPDDGLDAGPGGLAPEVEGTEEIAMVGDGHGFHALPVGFLEELAKTGRPVEHRVFGVGMKMNKSVACGTHASSLALGPRGISSGAGWGKPHSRRRFLPWTRHAPHKETAGCGNKN